MADVMEPPVVEGDSLVFRVHYAGRPYRAVVTGDGIQVRGDLGAHDEIVAAVRTYASEYVDELPEAFRRLPVLRP